MTVFIGLKVHNENSFNYAISTKLKKKVYFSLLIFK